MRTNLAKIKKGTEKNRKKNIKKSILLNEKTNML